MTKESEILQRKWDTAYDIQKFEVRSTKQYDQYNTADDERNNIGLQTAQVTGYIMSMFQQLNGMQVYADQDDTTGYHTVSLHKSKCKESTYTRNILPK